MLFLLRRSNTNKIFYVWWACQAYVFAANFNSPRNLKRQKTLCESARHMLSGKSGKYDSRAHLLFFFYWGHNSSDLASDTISADDTQIPRPRNAFQIIALFTDVSPTLVQHVRWPPLKLRPLFQFNGGFGIKHFFPRDRSSFQEEWEGNIWIINHCKTFKLNQDVKDS